MNGNLFRLPLKGFTAVVSISLVVFTACGSSVFSGKNDIGLPQALFQAQAGIAVKHGNSYMLFRCGYTTPDWISILSPWSLLKWHSRLLRSFGIQVRMLQHSYQTFASCMTAMFRYRCRASPTGLLPLPCCHGSELESLC